MRRMTNLLLALLLLLSLTACSSTPAPGSDGPSQPEPPAQAETPEADAPAEPEPEPYTILDPTVQPEGGVRDGVTYVPYDGVVEHLFFHPVVAYPELAFDGDSKSDGIDDWMVTAGEYLKILESVYEKGYVLVDIADCWSEQTDESGQTRMVKNTLYLPEGKKPLILSYDDVNYYEYMLANGFTYKLIIGEDGKLWSWGKDPQGKEVVSRDLDAVTILDKFVEEHPDFSPFGAKGCLSLTGYEGILGYRTQTDSKSWTAEQEANRQKGLYAAEAIWTRYMPSRQMINRAMEDIGRAWTLSANLSYPMPNKKRIHDPALGGGALLDIGIYGLNFAMMHFGSDFSRVDSSVQLTDTGVDGTESITCVYPDGRMAVLSQMDASICKAVEKFGADRIGIFPVPAGFLL